MDNNNVTSCSRSSEETGSQMNSAPNGPEPPLVPPLNVSTRLGANSPEAATTTSARERIHRTLSAPDLNNSLPTQSPGQINTNTNIRHGIPYDMKYMDPPSYEEAIKGTGHFTSYQPHLDVEDPAHFHHYPNYGQFDSTDSYFYPREYTETETEGEQKLSFCSKVVIFAVCCGIGIFVMRIFSS